jgi:hypothetical protein
MREPCTVALVLILVCVVSASARTGPDGKIRAFCYGDVIEQYGSFNSYAVIGTDPAIDTTLVPTRPGYLGGVENAKRNLRIYMPRTYDQMANGSPREGWASSGLVASGDRPARSNWTG